MRFVLVSTHIDQTTGYSKVSANLIKQITTLSPRVKLFHFGFQRHPSRSSIRKYPPGVLSYDAAANEDPKEEGFGFNKIHEYLEMVDPDVVMIYNDPITIYRFIEAMKYDPGKTRYKLWVYLDQVYEGIAPPLIEALRKNAERVYCFSEIWKKRFLEYGPAPDVRVLEHAVDPRVFSQMTPQARKALRSSVNVPADAIVLLNANRNSQRKRLDLTLQGFARAVLKNSKLHLILVTNANPQGGAYYDVQRIYLEELKLLGADSYTYLRNLIVVDTSPSNVIDDEGINQLYNLSDLGINTSDGEGYGLCQLEHLFTGAPQIVTDVGTYRSFLPETVATYIPVLCRGYFPGGMPHGGWYAISTPDAVATAIEEAVQTLEEKRFAVQGYTFKTWASICEEFLTDLLARTEGPDSIVSVPTTSRSPS